MSIQVCEGCQIDSPSGSGHYCFGGICQCQKSVCQDRKRQPAIPFGEVGFRLVIDRGNEQPHKIFLNGRAAELAKEIFESHSAIRAAGLVNLAQQVIFYATGGPVDRSAFDWGDKVLDIISNLLMKEMPFHTNDKEFAEDIMRAFGKIEEARAALRRSVIERKKSEKDLKDLLAAVEKEFECHDTHASSDALRGVRMLEGVDSKEVR